MSESKHSCLADAKAAAQNQYRSVSKDKTAKIRTKTGGEYSYHYADWGDVLKMALPILSKNGLAFGQPLRWRDGQLFVTSELRFGPEEKEVSDGIPIRYDIMTPQELGSCLTYWKRYDGCALLGIQPDEDDDGQAATATHKERGNEIREIRKPQPEADPRITPADIREFWKEVRKSGKTNEQVATYLADLGHAQTEQLKQSEYDSALAWARTTFTVTPQTAEESVEALEASLSMVEAQKAAKAPANAKEALLTSKERTVEAVKAAVQSNLDAAAPVLKRSVGESDPVWKSFWPLAKKHGVSNEDVHVYAKEKYGVESLKELDPIQFGQLLGWVTAQEA